MANCKACGAWFSSTAPDEICPTCERALKRLNGYAMPVVRCKGCKHCMLCYPEKQIGKDATPGWYCKDQKKYRRPDDFCSYGERREGE